MYTDVKGVWQGLCSQLMAGSYALATYPGVSIFIFGLNMSVSSTPPAETANNFTFALVSRVNGEIKKKGKKVQSEYNANMVRTEFSWKSI
jgi:hypothetical protein